MTSDVTELDRHPTALGIPDRKWPKAVATAVAKWEKAWDEWDKENVILHDRNQEKVQAERASTEAMLDAVKKGLPDPGELPEVQETRRALMFQNERVRHLRKTADKEAREVARLMEENAAELIAQACDEAEAFASEYPAMVKDLSAQYDAMVKKRHDAYALLRWVERLTDGKIQYEPSFPLEGLASFPQTHENRVWGVIEILRKLYLQKDEDES